MATFERKTMCGAQEWVVAGDPHEAAEKFVWNLLHRMNRGDERARQEVETMLEASVRREVKEVG